MLVLKAISYFFNGTNGFSIDIKNALNEEIIELNRKRSIRLCIALTVLDIILIFFDVFIYRSLWTEVPHYINLYYSHIIMLIFFTLYLFFSTAAGITINKAQKLLYLCFLLSTLFWCSYLAVNAQGIHMQISAYIIGCFCLASGFILTPKESIIILFSTAAYTIYGLFITQQSFKIMASNLINLTFTIILASIISRLNFGYFVKDYINKRTILLQKEQLEDIKENLERAVNTRTLELARANELLLEEVNIRHEAEIESYKAKLRYEETSKILDKTIEYEQCRSSFFANLSHELRTPVNVIYSALQMLQLLLNTENDVDNKPKMNKYMKIIKQNCFRLIRLVGNLIDITKIDSNHFKINLHCCDIIKLMENITLSVADYIESKRINLIFDTEVEEKVIQCDPDLIERIILNLLSNAVKFTEEDGFIYVLISEKDNKTILTVKDTGCGIPLDKQGAIFERYTQASNAASINAPSSGIGLSLVKSLVEMHGGTVSLKSEVAKGSEFIIELPDKCLQDDECQIAAASYNNVNIDRINIEFSDIYL